MAPSAFESMAASLNLKSAALKQRISGSGPLWPAFVDKTREGGVLIMPLIHVVVVLIVVGVVLWLINQFIPMAGSIKSILNAVVVIVVILWLLSVFGLIGSLSKIHLGK
jgi:hypothetical protein